MISKDNVIDLLNRWGEFVVEAGKLKDDFEKQKEFASKQLPNFYDFEDNKLLFSPTKAADDQFRRTLEGTLSYFVGNNNNFPEDHGFTNNPWTNVRFDFVDIVIVNNVALAMGNYFFGEENNKETKAEFTFAVTENKDGNPRIILHHSAFPYKKGL